VKYLAITVGFLTLLVAGTASANPCGYNPCGYAPRHHERHIIGYRKVPIYGYKHHQHKHRPSCGGAVINNCVVVTPPPAPVIQPIVPDCRRPVALPTAPCGGPQCAPAGNPGPGNWTNSGPSELCNGRRGQHFTLPDGRQAYCD
jgi:hypothetical protein